MDQQKSKNPNKNDDNEELQSDQVQDVPDWLQVAIVPDELLCCRLVWYMGENTCANGLSQSANQTCPIAEEAVSSH